MSEWAYTVIGTNVIIDCGTAEEAVAYERELWANQPYAPATPAPLAVDAPDNANAATTSANVTPVPLDVDRLARALFVICAACEPGEEYTDNHHRRHAEAIAAAYAEEAPDEGNEWQERNE